MPAGRRALCALLLLAAPAGVLAQAPQRMRIDILPGSEPGDLDLEDLLQRLREAIADRGVGVPKPVDDYAELGGLEPDTVIANRKLSTKPAVDIYSATNVRSTAGGDFRLSSGGAFKARTTDEASLIAGGAVELDSLGAVGLASADDVEFLTEGDVAAMSSGAVQIDAGSLDSQIAGAGRVTAGGDLRAAAGGAATMDAAKLHANVRGDAGLLGAAVDIAGTKGLSVVAGNVDVQTPGATHLQTAGGMAQMDGSLDISSRGNLEAAAAASMRMTADGVSVNAASSLDVSASDSAGLVTKDMRVLASGEMDTSAGSVDLRVAEDINAFSGDDLSASTGRVNAQLRGSGDLTASGDIHVNGVSTKATLTGEVSAAAESARVNANSLDVKTSELKAVAAETAALHTVDMSLSADGTVSAYMASGEILAEADLGLQSAGSLSLRSDGKVDLLSADSASFRSRYELVTKTESMRVNADNVNVYSDTDVRTTADHDVRVMAGGDLTARTTGEASVIAGGDLELRTPGTTKLFSANDAEFGVEGDAGVATSGSVSIDAGSLRSQVAAAGGVTAGGDLRAAAGGGAAFGASSLQANLRGLGWIAGGANVDIGGTEGLSVLAGEMVEVQTPGAVHVQAAGGTAKLDGSIDVASSSNLEATAAADMLLAANEVSLNAGSSLDVSAAGSTGLSAKDMSVHALGGLDATAGTADLRVADAINAFSKGDLSGSFAAVSAGLRGDAEMTTAGDLSMSSDSGTISLTGDATASAESLRLNTNKLDTVLPRLDASASERASLHTTDASISADGTLSAFFAGAEITAEADLGLQAAGSLDLRTLGGVELLSRDSTTLNTGSLSAITSSVKVVAGQGQQPNSEVMNIDIDCESDADGGCDEEGLRVEMARLLGVPIERLRAFAL